MIAPNPVSEDEAETLLEALQDAEPEYDAVASHLDFMRSILGPNRGQFQADYILAQGFLLLSELLQRQHREQQELLVSMDKSLERLWRDR